MERDEVVKQIAKAMQAFVGGLALFRSPKVAWCIAKDDVKEWGKVYVRRSQRLINRKMTQCLDFSSVEIAPELQKQGIMSELLSILEDINPWDTVYVENVMDPLLVEAFQRRGYITDASKSGEGATCLYKRREIQTT